MKEPILVIMAAGMGSRYGGLKQIDPVGEHGELIIDYSLYDAYRAGFRRVVFLIKREIEEDFKELIGRRMEKVFQVSYAYQQREDLPQGFRCPPERGKPWGTGHAVLCCKELVDAPFLVINADDYYGASAFQAAYGVLKNLKDGEKKEYFMVGYLLENTLTDHGHVARGVCRVTKDGELSEITERTHIIKTCDGAMFTEDGETYRLLPENAAVSMNLWGFTESFLEALENQFPAFLEKALRENPLKAEFFLPAAVEQLLKNGECRVRVLESRDRWYGVTYREDKPVVADALRRLATEGLYETPLWRGVERSGADGN